MDLKIWGVLLTNGRRCTRQMPLLTQVLGWKLWGNAVIFPSQNNCNSLKIMFHNKMFLNCGLYDKRFFWSNVPSLVEDFWLWDVKRQRLYLIFIGLGVRGKRNNLAIALDPPAMLCSDSGEELWFCRSDTSSKKKKRCLCFANPCMPSNISKQIAWAHFMTSGRGSIRVPSPSWKKQSCSIPSLDSTRGSNNTGKGNPILSLQWHLQLPSELRMQPLEVWSLHYIPFSISSEMGMVSLDSCSSRSR